MKRIKLVNRFHNTTMYILADDEMLDYPGGPMVIIEGRAAEGRVSERDRLARIKRTLCGQAGCGCSYMIEVAP
jgi:hypothetical protein